MLDDIGNRDAEPGSSPWAKWFTLMAKQARDRLNSDASNLSMLIARLEKHEAWKVLGYTSMTMLCEKEIGLSSDQLEKIHAAKPGQSIGATLNEYPGPKPGTMTLASRRNAPIGNNITNRCKARGTSEAYLLARLRRDHPDLAAKYDAGGFPSVRAAAIEAGIVEPSFQCSFDPTKAARTINRLFPGDRFTALVSAVQRLRGNAPE
jgi:hypothetical protein